MLFELFEVFKYAVSEIFQSTVRSINIVLGAIVYMVQIIRAEWAVSSILERMLVLVFALGIVFAAYKLLWDSAKLIVVFFIVIFLMLFAEGFLF
ncbi:MAG: hypothetical protein ABIF85_05835 [Nanoarchaeota archaeon]|nr:hypothetical protein [Nanoarchaeota archaeon]MBU4299865.1 hypothetical protein [Nanoarchaeota archaeon]MBU4451645.1 hypothetical protein [Nanoarchaeota archaeon]MCG2723632.1 hypothetical protein [archaeon]